MKISKLRLKNFVRFEDFEIVFNDSITNLVGINGAGKTTVGLTALWAGFKGIAEKSSTGHLIGERFRFISEGKKSLDIEITLKDELMDRTIVLTRHVTKSTNTIKITQDKDSELSKEYIENLFNVSFLSATHFSALTGKQQAAAMGMDTGLFDRALKDKKEDAQGYRRDIKKIGELVPVEECEKKDIKVLQIQHNAATEHNAIQTTLTSQLSTLNYGLETVNNNIHDEIESFETLRRNHERRLEGFHKTRTETKDNIKGFPVIEPPVSLEPINKAIEDIVESNEMFFLYETYTTKLSNRWELEQHLEDNLALQKDIQDERGKYLQSKSFGIKRLQIDEDGNLTKDDKLIREPYFSKGELEILVARIGMNLNPELKVRFIDNFDLIDDDNQEKLIKHLTKKGFQIITATVGKKVKDSNSVLLRACKLHKPQDNAVRTNGVSVPKDDGFDYTEGEPEQTDSILDNTMDGDIKNKDDEDDEF